MVEKKKRGRPRKKTDREFYEEMQKTKRILRSKITPGEWSRDTDLYVVAKLKKTCSCVPNFLPYLGKYLTHSYKLISDAYAYENYGTLYEHKYNGYWAKIKISVDNLPAIVKKHGIDEVLAACEKSLNSYKYKNGKKVLGDLVILELLSDEKSKREGYLPCLVKTNRRHIPQFMGIKKGELQVF